MKIWNAGLATKWNNIEVEAIKKTEIKKICIKKLIKISKAQQNFSN